MKTKSDLEKYTNEFFDLYWNSKNGEPPKWSEPWDFNSEIPNNTLQGCYALLKNDEIVYIGVAIHKNNGIGSRLHSYWRVNKDPNIETKYVPCKDYNNLMTIGFDTNHYPLAAALEIHLIRELDPILNVQHRKEQ